MGERGRVLLGVSAVWLPLAFLYDGVTLLVLPLRVGGDATSLGLVSLVGLGIAAGLQPLAGWASDRLAGRVDRRLFIAAAAVPAVAGLWILAASASLATALAGYVILQAGATAVQAGQQTLIPEHVAPDRQGRASGLKVAFDIGGAAVAFLVLGALLADGDAMAAAAVVSLVLLTAVAVMWVTVPRTSPSGRGPARQPIRLVDRRDLSAEASGTPSGPVGLPSGKLGLPAGLPALIAARALFLLGTFTVGRFLVLLVAERSGISAERAVDESSAFLAVFAMVTALAALGFGWLADRWARHDAMVVGTVFAAAGVLVLVPTAGLPGILAGGLLLALGNAAFLSASWAAMTGLVKPADSGRVMGIANLGTGLAAAAAGILGPLIDAAGFELALLVAASCVAAAIPLVARQALASPVGNAAR
jgi:MFS family permease